MKYTKKTAFEAADAFGIGAPNDTYALVFYRAVVSETPDRTGEGTGFSGKRNL